MGSTIKLVLLVLAGWACFHLFAMHWVHSHPGHQRQRTQEDELPIQRVHIGTSSQKPTGQKVPTTQALRESLEPRSPLQKEKRTDRCSESARASPVHSKFDDLHLLPPSTKIPQKQGTQDASRLHGVPSPHGRLDFIILGDWGGPAHEPQKDVAKAMDMVSREKIVGSWPLGGAASSTRVPKLDFIVSTGDNIYEDGVDSVNDFRLKRNFEHVYTYPTQHTRWYMSLGNHDHGAHGVHRNIMAQVNYTLYGTRRWYMPWTYYTQRIVYNAEGTDSLLLIVLDTYDVSPYKTQMSKQQLDWYESVMDACADEATWKIVVGHRPLFSAGLKHGSSPYMQKKLMPMMKKHKVAAYLSGDDHDLQLLKSNGIYFVLSGGGSRAKTDLRKGGVKQSIYQYGGHGFVYAVIQSNKKSGKSEMILTYHGRNGTTLFEETLQKP